LRGGLGLGTRALLVGHPRMRCRSSAGLSRPPLWPQVGRRVGPRLQVRRVGWGDRLAPTWPQTPQEPASLVPLLAILTEALPGGPVHPLVPSSIGDGPPDKRPDNIAIGLVLLGFRGIVVGVEGANLSAPLPHPTWPRILVPLAGPRRALLWVHDGNTECGDPGRSPEGNDWDAQSWVIWCESEWKCWQILVGGLDSRAPQSALGKIQLDSNRPEGLLEIKQSRKYVWGLAHNVSVVPPPFFTFCFCFL